MEKQNFQTFPQPLLLLFGGENPNRLPRKRGKWSKSPPPPFRCASEAPSSIILTILHFLNGGYYDNRNEIKKAS